MNDLPIGKKINLPGHFDVVMILEAARGFERGFECRVRLPDGALDNAAITAEEAAALAEASEPVESKAITFDFTLTVQPTTITDWEHRHGPQEI